MRSRLGCAEFVKYLPAVNCMPHTFYQLPYIFLHSIWNEKFTQLVNGGIDCETSPTTYLKSKHFLVNILKPELPSRSRPDSPYKQPDSHSVGSLQLLHKIPYSCLMRSFFLSLIVFAWWAYLIDPIGPICEAVMFWPYRLTHIPLRHHYTVVHESISVSISDLQSTEEKNSYSTISTFCAF